MNRRADKNVVYQRKKDNNFQFIKKTDKAKTNLNKLL